MSQQKQGPYPPPTTTTKLRQEKPFVQVKEVLTEVQLDAIASGATGGGWGGNHNETMVRASERND